MAYCVHCGVELAPSEPRCPLCGTMVCHPEQPWREPEESPYPRRVEVVRQRYNRMFGARLATAILIIPMAVALLLDLLIGTGLTWSPYVLGAGGWVFAWALLPFYAEWRRPYPHIAVDTIATAAYLMLIALMTGGGNWYWWLALPLTLLSGFATSVAVLICRRTRLAPLDRVAYTVFVVAVSLMGVEALIDRFAFGRAALTWSLYAVASLLALGSAFIIIERDEKLKERIAKRLYL
jgi:hypothetical protein